MQPMRLLAFALLVVSAACGKDSTSPGSNGTMQVRLTDAPFPTNEVRSVDVFVIRVEGRLTAASDADANADLESGSSAGWRTLASPNATYNLLSLQNGAAVTLGEASVAAGSYNGFRLIIDPTKSSVTLKTGTVLTSTSSPNVAFPSAAKSGIKINVSNPVQVVAGATTTLLVDFDVSNSFVMRGNTVAQNGLLFTPVIHATIVDAATVNATVRLVNGTDGSLDLFRTGTALTGSSNLTFGTSSACSSVNAASPGLSVVTSGSTTALSGFSPTLTAGTAFTVVAYPTLTGGVQFATLSNAFTPASGQSGLRVFNATTAAVGFDVFLTALGASLGTAVASNVVAGGSSTFVNVPAGSQQVRITVAGSTAVLVDLGAQTFSPGQNMTLVIGPPIVGSTAYRAFLASGC
jgi:hypothetical protein